MVSWDGLWGVWGKLGVHRPPGGLPEGLFVDLRSPLRSSVGPWVVFEGQLDTLFGSKSNFERDCVLLGNRRAAYT